MWSISTKPCPVITWDGEVFNGEHHYVDHIYYMIHACPFGLSVPWPYLNMLGSSSLTRVFLRVQTLACTRCRWTLSLSHPIITWCLGTTNFGNGAYSGRTCTLKFSERSSYNATAILSKIRSIKDKHHMQSKYVTWYGYDHLAPLISISKVPSWSLSSPAWHHDLHHLDLYQRVVT